MNRIIIILHHSTGRKNDNIEEMCTFYIHYAGVFVTLNTKNK